MSQYTVLAVVAFLGRPSLGIASATNEVPDSAYHRGPWNFNSKCPSSFTYDPPGQQRDVVETGTQYAYFNATESATDCANVCCSDWSCWGFLWYPHGFIGNNTAQWAKPGKFHQPCGEWCDDDSTSKLGNFCSDPVQPCCVLLADFEDPLTKTTINGTVSAVRGKLPARTPPGEASSLIKTVTFGSQLYIGGLGVYPEYSPLWNIGDEFPTTWADDGYQYAGAGDNNGGKAYPGTDSPLTMWRIDGNDPPTAKFSLVGKHIPVDSPKVREACPIRKSGAPNLKSQSVLALGKTLYWAVACFDYIDPDLSKAFRGISKHGEKVWDLGRARGLHPSFNRQRYGVNDTSFIAVSTDGGKSWNADATEPQFFRGRLASPRFINAGQGYRDAPEPMHVYVLFVGTSTDNKAFFEQNDAMWLGRVPVGSMLNRSTWQFFSGLSGADSAPSWSVDDTLAVPVFEHPLMTAMQQCTYVPQLRRYIMPVWSWCDPDGNPRGQLTKANTGGAAWGYNTSGSKDIHDRTQLTLWEAEHPWGPWRYFYRSDDWRGPDNSSGGYTPVFPPAWLGRHEKNASKNSNSSFTMWMSFTQCCPGNAQPPNHYNYTYQALQLELANVSVDAVLSKLQNPIGGLLV